MVAMKQREPERRLELFDCCGDGGLRHVHLGGGGRELPGLCSRQEILDLLQTYLHQ
jgi:hypothetical protein